MSIVSLTGDTSKQPVICFAIFAVLGAFARTLSFEVDKNETPVSRKGAKYRKDR